MAELGRMDVASFQAADKRPVWVVLDNVRSMHNVGSVFRSADAFRLAGISLCGYTPQPPHRDIQKTALGATETVAWNHFDTVVAAVKDLQNKGYAVYALEQARGAVSLENFVLPPQPLAFILGNEVEGVSADALPLCQGCIEIPQFGTKHSLNVAVAAGILFWKTTELFLAASPQPQP
ncbi:MAG: TrmH family RNA methyltransferase [Sphingobacteriia bacterium]|nr:MAG: TrmH family RNA methyltransferase [Sphingobacteriia bacterium]